MKLDLQLRKMTTKLTNKSDSIFVLRFRCDFQYIFFRFFKIRLLRKWFLFYDEERAL